MRDADWVLTPQVQSRGGGVLRVPFMVVRKWQARGLCIVCELSKSPIRSQELSAIMVSDVDTLCNE